MSTPSVAVVDAWANLALPETLRETPGIARLLRQARAGQVFAKGIETAAMIAEMDRAGIAAALMTAWHRPGVWTYSNRLVDELARQYPGRIVPVASVEVARPAAGVDELRRAVGQRGFRALRLVPWLWGLPPDDRLYFPLYATCVELDVPVCLQVGHTGPLMPSAPGRPIPHLENVALAFPELRLVGGHLGYPWTDEMLVLAEKFPHVYIDTSAHLPKYYPPQLIDFLRGPGRSKVLFGSNYPMLRWETCVAQVRALGLPLDVEADFLAGNARRVYRLE